MFKEQQSVSGIRYKHVVKYNFHSFFSRFLQNLATIPTFFFFFFTLQNLAGFTELLVSFLIAERSASSVL